MTDTLPPIKGAVSSSSATGNDGKSDLTNTRDISQSALESDRTLIKGDTKQNDIEVGRIQKNSKKVSPEMDDMKKDLGKEHRENKAEESRSMRMKVAVAVALMTIVAAIIVLLAVDMRASDALIEKPMIKVFDTFPTEKAIASALHWQSKNPFPLRDLVSNGTIHIDTAFKVDKMTLTPDYIKLGSSVYR